MRVCERRRETPSAVSLVLEPLDDQPLHFRAGQFLTVLVPIGGEVHRRAYSLSSPEGSDPPTITIKAIPDGRVSEHLNHRIEVGDLLRVLGPSGEFTVASGQRRLVLIAGGSGITPIASILDSVLRADPESDITLIHGHRETSEVIFFERFERLKTAYSPRLTVHLALEHAPSEFDGHIGVLNRDYLEGKLRPLDGDEVHYYVCGPTPMMTAAREALDAIGVQPHRVHEERFTRPEARRVAPSELTAIPQSITAAIGTECRTFRQGPHQTVLEAALAAGVPLPYSCAMGGCGACRVRRVEGSISVDEPNCLRSEERSADYVLTCIGRATSPLKIEVPHG